tara:strand:- start:637 stop:825 length:189 start_codon:yes stop_codon:yes gene_type:complete
LFLSKPPTAICCIPRTEKGRLIVTIVLQKKMNQQIAMTNMFSQLLYVQLRNFIEKINKDLAN